MTVLGELGCRRRACFEGERTKDEDEWPQRQWEVQPCQRSQASETPMPKLTVCLQQSAGRSERKTRDPIGHLPKLSIMRCYY